MSTRNLPMQINARRMSLRKSPWKNSREKVQRKSPGEKEQQKHPRLKNARKVLLRRCAWKETRAELLGEKAAAIECTQSARQNNAPCTVRAQTRERREKPPQNSAWKKTAKNPGKKNRKPLQMSAHKRP